MALDIVDIIHTDGIENPPGLATMHGVTLISDYTTITKAPGLQDVSTTLPLVGTVTTPHVFKTGKCMRKLYGTENLGEHKESKVGNSFDSQAAKDTGTLMIPGSRAELNGMARLLNCSQGLLFTQEADGQVRQHGSEAFPCHFNMVYASGNNEGYRGYTLTWQCYGPSAIYAGGLNFTPAT